MVFSLRRAKKQDDRDEDVIVDRVTGAFNRRQLDAVVAAGLDVVGQPTATLLVRVDDFDHYGDRPGDTNADRVLERVSWVIMATVRTSDVVYRHDQSTFCVLLPATDSENGLMVADRVRGNVEQMPLLLDAGVTVSIASAAGVSDDIASTIERADEVLNGAVLTATNQVIDGGIVAEADPSKSASIDPIVVSPTESTPTSDTPPMGIEGVAVEPSASIPLTPPTV